MNGGEGYLHFSREFGKASFFGWNKRLASLINLCLKYCKVFFALRYWNSERTNKIEKKIALVLILSENKPQNWSRVRMEFGKKDEWFLSVRPKS